MLGKFDSKKKTVGDSGNGKLLHEIEALSKALYLNKKPSKALVSTSDNRSISAGKSHVPEPKPKSRVLTEPQSQKDKKSSIWNWKPLKALSAHIRNRRFNCCFTLQVHSIEGLPSIFNDANLCVHWRRRDGGLQTRSARVFHGIAEFEETLAYKCSIYGSGTGPHHTAKYEAKFFLLYASVVINPDLDLGKHRIDLTRLLPLSLEELEEEKSSGKWTTSFKLSGKAKGASLNVSFGFLVLGDELVGSGSNKLNRAGTSKALVGFERGDGRGSLRRVGSLPCTTHATRDRSRSVEDVKILHEVLPSSKSEIHEVLPSSKSEMPSSHVVGQMLTDQEFSKGELSSLVDSKPELEAFSDHKDDKESLELKSCPFSDSFKENCESGFDDVEFTVIEQGVEMVSQCQVKLDENMEAVGCPGLENLKLDEFDRQHGLSSEEGTKPDKPDEACETFHEDLPLADNHSKEDNSLFIKESIIEELDTAFNNLSILGAEGLDSPQTQIQCPEQVNCMETKSTLKKGKMGKSLSFDDVTESVASEFLSMLGIEHSPFTLSSDSDPESPRGRLWKQFEKESLSSGNNVFGLDIGEGKELESDYDPPGKSDWGDLPEDFELSSIVHAAETEHQKATQAMRSKTRAKILEDAETEALMREWGLNEKAFQSSPPGSSSGGFGSPINLPPEGPFDLPPLSDGLGPFLQTKDGGFLRSMNPSIFRNAKNKGSLIMQVSSPVVVPAEMGSGIMEILERLASVGIEKLSIQASKLMPLEDITGKTMQQVAWEAAPSLEACQRQDLLQQHLKSEVESEVGQDAFVGGRKKCKGSSGRSSKSKSSLSSRETGSEYVSLEDLAPLAMDKVEALSIEGLRIQSGVSDEDAPSNISPQSFGEISALEGKRANISGSLGLEGAAGLQLLDIKNSSDDVDGLMGLSITLDEWMRLDSGIVDEKDQSSGRTSKILAAHHAKSADFVSGGCKGEKRGSKSSGKRWGLLGNNFTVALMVQLRDPLRNYEPVGAPMLSLIQVERVFVPPKPKIYWTVSDKGNSEEVDESEPLAKEVKKEEKIEEQGIPQFKITEVHVAGLKSETGKKKLWGTTTQQQSGSRWLLASGMGKSNKHPFMKSKVVSKSPQATTTVQPGDTLWSISSRVHGTGAKWKELAALNPHIRNPNVIFPNETIRLR